MQRYVLEETVFGVKNNEEVKFAINTYESPNETGFDARICKTFKNEIRNGKLKYEWEKIGDKEARIKLTGLLVWDGLDVSDVCITYNLQSDCVKKITASLFTILPKELYSNLKALYKKTGEETVGFFDEVKDDDGLLEGVKVSKTLYIHYINAVKTLSLKKDRGVLITLHLEDVRKYSNVYLSSDENVIMPITVRDGLDFKDYNAILTANEDFPYMTKKDDSFVSNKPCFFGYSNCPIQKISFIPEEIKEGSEPNRKWNKIRIEFAKGVYIKYIATSLAFSTPKINLLCANERKQKCIFIYGINKIVITKEKGIVVIEVIPSF